MRPQFAFHVFPAYRLSIVINHSFLQGETMKVLRPFLAATVLTLALSLNTFAGQMETGFTSAPPDQPNATGQMETGIAPTSEGATPDSVAEVALNLIQSVLSLF